ncbi:MAG: hypothetical protein ACRDQA_22715 [Nocardioidaceae bacterium]
MATDRVRVEAGIAAPHYTSTYCMHGQHGRCRLTCKVCGSPCRCDCHQKECTCTTGPDWDGPDVACGVHGSPSHAYKAGYDRALHNTADLIRASVQPGCEMCAAMRTALQVLEADHA